VNEDSVCQGSFGSAMTETLSQEERPQRADARRNRERILQAAQEVFSEFGGDAQVDDVARRAGVGVGTVYRHFPTKEALMVELVRHKFRALAAGARQALNRPGEPFEVLTDLLRENAELLHRDAAMQQTLVGFDEQIWTQAQPEQAELLGLTGQLIARARSAGTIRPDTTEWDIAMLMCGLSATMAHRGPGFDWRRHLELLIDMLRAR
jgi:AcrR family transcriptional regulator